jgi:phage-related protein
MKTALATLGVTSTASAGSIGLATIATNLLKIALAGLGIGLVIAAIVLLVQNWDSITAAVSKFWEKVKDVVPKAWAKVMELKDKIVGYISTIKGAFDELPEKMLAIGSNIVKGLWNGMQNMASWLKDKVTGFFKNLIPSWAEKALGISSPSKVFASIGKNIIGGLQSTFNAPAVKAVSNRAQAGIAVPKMSLPSLQSKSGVNITINAGLGTNGAALGRQVSSAISQYGKISTKTRF